MAPSRTTSAALKTLNEEFNVSEMLAHIDVLTEDLQTALDVAAAARTSYDNCLTRVNDRKNAILNGVTMSARKENSKVSQTAVDGQVKLAMTTDVPLAELELDLANAKIELADADAQVTIAKADHRAALAKMDLVGASLRFMAESKSARAALVGVLKEM